jgi:predicted RNA-binding Zn-ribbon protein involved in translation (DUF1610 family)
LISVSDILKILDQVPIWKTVKELPKRVEALEKEHAALKAELDQLRSAPKQKPGETCPACGEPAMRRTKSEPTKGTFAGMGLRDETWTCSECGEVDIREMQSAR